MKTAILRLAAAFAALVLVLVSLAAGPALRSTQYDGSAADRSVYAPGEGVVTTVPMTIEAWVYREDATRCETVVGRDWAQSYWLGFCGDHVRFYRSGGAFADADLNVQARAWTHVAVAYDGKQAMFYLDGEPAGERLLAHGEAPNPDSLSLGGDVTGFPFLGKLDEVRIWSGVRSADEVREHLFRELTGTETGLVFRSALGGNRATQGRVVGILPGNLVIPPASEAVVVDGDVDPAEYAGAEQLVIRYRNGSGVADAVAHLVYRDQGGDRNLYVGVQGLRDVGPNWTRSQSFVTLNIDPDRSGGPIPETSDYRVRGFLDAAPAVWEWGNGNGGFSSNPNPPPVSAWPVAYSYLCSGEFNPPCMEFRLAGEWVNDLQGTVGLSMLHNWVLGQADDYPAPGDAVWNVPASWAETTFDRPVLEPYIQGQITDDQANALAGVAVVLTGDDRRALVTDANGSYQFDALAPGGNYQIFPYLEGYRFDPQSVEISAPASPELVNFVGELDPNFQLPAVQLPGKPSGIVLSLNQAVYEPGDVVSLSLNLNGRTSTRDSLPAILVSLPGGDVEVMDLFKVEPDRYESAVPMLVGAMAGDGEIRFDGTFMIAPGDEVVALWYVADLDPASPPVEEFLVYDYALALDADDNRAPSVVVADLAMTEDELTPPPGGRPLATLLGRGGVPVQVPADQLIVYPRDQAELNRFLEFARGKTLATNDDPQDDPDAAGLPAVLVEVDPAMMDLRALSQLRALFGHGGELFASNEAGLRILQLALLSQMEGFIVSLNPRIQLAGAPAISEQDPNTLAANLALSTEEVLNVPKLWSFLSVFDFDEARIPLAVLDIGFAPNPDFRGFEEGAIFQRAVTLGGVVGGPGAAEGVPTVGNSFFGDKSWHGNGVVTIAGGVLNNGWGSAGVGGQVVVPMLYKYDLGSYAFGIGTGIRHATSSGAAVINLSGGYPCNLQTDLGDFNICDPAARAAFCAAVTAAVAAASSAACAATAAFLPFLAPVVCTAATAATVAAGEACVALVAAGDVREPMRSAVEFAAARGVPVITIAGNALNPDNLPAVIKDLVDLDDPRVETWQIYPAMVPATIVVGATESVWPYANQHFHGDRVDVWAPIRASYFAPPTTTAPAPFTEHIRNPDNPDGLGGTSAATPFVAGVVAAMQAVNPLLFRHTPGLTGDQLRNIVPEIKTLLAESAWTVAELEALAPDPAQAEAVVAGAAQRRNLVNPLRAVQSAAADRLPDLAALGYELSWGFSETTPELSADTEDHAREISGTGTWADGFFSQPGERFEPTWHDRDWYRFQIPSPAPGGPGLYEQRFELRVPHGFDSPMIYPLAYRIYLAGFTADEAIFRVVSPPLPDGANGRFRVHGAGRLDNLYRLSRYILRRVGDLPDPDRFDLNHPTLTPPESRPDNNVPARAAILGAPGEFAWRFDRGTALGDNWAIILPDLSIHNLSDVDHFALTAFPPFTIGELPGCNPYVELDFGGDMLLTATLPDGTVVFASQESPLVLPVFALFDDRVNLELRAKPDRVAHYRLECRFHAANPRICAMAEALGEARAAGEARGSRVFEFPGILPGIPDFGPGAYGPLPPRTIDQEGRVTSPDGYLINWRESGRFTAAFDLLAGDSLWVRLVDLNGSILAETRTPNLPAVSMVRQHGPAPHNLDPRASGLGLLLEAADLPAGDYWLLFSHAALGTLIDMLLPDGAVQDGSPSFESVQAGPQPEPPTIQFEFTPNGLRLFWPIEEFEYALEARPTLEPAASWFPVEPAAQSNGDHYEILLPSGTGNSFFRLRLIPGNQP